MNVPSSTIKTVVLCRNWKHLTCCNYLITSRNTSTTKKREEKINCDLVSQPNPVSNLRKFKFYVPKNENEIEREYRLKREEVQKWNEDFWTKHNSNFIKERKEFIALHEKETTTDGVKEPMSADKLSIFYKRFLDKNWKTHLNYNYEWYKKNAMLILLAVRVKIHQLKDLRLKNS